MADAERSHNSIWPLAQRTKYCCYSIEKLWFHVTSLIYVKIKLNGDEQEKNKR